MGMVLAKLIEKIKSETNLKIYGFKTYRLGRPKNAVDCFSWSARTKYNNYLVRCKIPAKKLISMKSYQVVYHHDFIEITATPFGEDAPVKVEPIKKVAFKFDMNDEVRIKFTDAGLLHLAKSMYITEHPDRIAHYVKFLQIESDCFGFLKIQMLRFLTAFGTADNSNNFYYENEILINNTNLK